jgi:hypothetical protein
MRLAMLACQTLQCETETPQLGFALWRNHETQKATSHTRPTIREDAFNATLAQPLVVDGKPVAPAGSSLPGTVTESHKAGRFKGGAAWIEHAHYRLADVPHLHHGNVANFEGQRRADGGNRCGRRWRWRFDRRSGGGGKAV